MTVTARPLSPQFEHLFPTAVVAASVAVAAVVSVGSYALGPAPVVLALAAVSYLVLAATRPDIGLLAALALAPFESVQIPVAGLGGLSPTEGAFVALAAGWAFRLARGSRVAVPELGDLPPIVLVLALLPGVAVGAPVAVVAKLVVMWSAFFIVSLVARELTRTQIHRVLLGLAFAAALLAALGLANYVNGGGAKISGNGTSVSGRASAAIEDPNYYGAYLLLTALPVTGLLVFGLVRSWRRGLLLIGFALVVAAIVLSLSRGALLGLVLGIGLIALSTSRSRAVTATILLALLAITGVGMNPLLKSRAVEMADTRLSSITASTSNNERPLLWSAAIRTVEKHPVFGIGALQFQNVTQRRGITQRGRPLENVHNAYLNLAAELGLLGLGAFLAWLLVIARSLIRALHGSRWSRAAAVGLGAALSSYLLQSFTVSPYQVEMIQATFFLLAGLAMRLGELADDETAPSPPDSQLATRR